MAGTGHIYMTAHGEFTGVWAGETAQVGLRMTFRNFGASSGPIIDLPDLGVPRYTYSDYSNTLFNVVHSFDQDLPGIGNTWSGICDDMAADWHVWMTAIKGQQCNLFKWTSLKFAPIEKGTGKYLAPSTVYTLKTPLVGAGTSALPPECAIAISQRAGVVGKRGRGRMYLPGLATSAVGSDGKVGSPARTQMATATVTLIDSLEDQPGVDDMTSNIIICSAQSTTAVIPSEVRVGDHVDVQRRRQHQVTEAYTIQPL